MNETDPSEPVFTYLEYIEFSGPQEFKRFKNEEIITEEQIKACNLNALCVLLQRREEKSNEGERVSRTV